MGIINKSHRFGVILQSFVIKNNNLYEKQKTFKTNLFLSYDQNKVNQIKIRRTALTMPALLLYLITHSLFFHILKAVYLTKLTNLLKCVIEIDMVSKFFCTLCQNLRLFLILIIRTVTILLTIIITNKFINKRTFRIIIVNNKLIT